MPSTKSGRAPAPKLPRHWSEAKNEAEEAAWWDANSERLMLQAAKRGQLKMGTLKQLMAQIEGNQPEETKLLSLRIAVSDIERAKAQAEKKGMGYQTYLKSLLHQALTGDAAPVGQWQRSGEAGRRQQKIQRLKESRGD